VFHRPSVRLAVHQARIAGLLATVPTVNTNRAALRGLIVCLSVSATGWCTEGSKPFVLLSVLAPSNERRGGLLLRMLLFSSFWFGAQEKRSAFRVTLVAPIGRFSSVLGKISMGYQGDLVRKLLGTANGIPSI
jgi:hypothetical protein